MTNQATKAAAPAETADAGRSAEVLRRALVELKAARAEAADARRLLTEPIAVVGMGCRFPGGAVGLESFWELLVDGRSGVVEVPADRWKVDDFYDPDPGAAGRTYSRHGGFVDGVREFDAGLFGIPPREAVGVDPQHRFVLEVAWEALEHAGIAPDSLRGSRTGVFVGMGGSDFERLRLSTSDVSAIDAYAATGGSQNMASNRLSFALGLEGPSMTVDTACSSSLVALHLAAQALRAGECDTALVAGVNLMLSPGTTVALSKAQMLSPEGRCKTFDASADGYVRGEGCGVVVLRRADVARESGQRVWAVVRGTATNQDGRSSGLTVPRGPAQQDVIRKALDVAGVRPAEVGYVEAHGTGTSLGDPIEVRALAAVLGEGRKESGAGPVALGSVKTNIGHLEAGAGIAALIKAVLTVERGLIPPHLNLATPNPYIAWEQLPVTVPTTATPWRSERRVAGVSSFGFGGTNAHAVIESAPAPEGAQDEAGAAEGPFLVKVSGHGAMALRAGAARLASWAAARDGQAGGNAPRLADVAWTAGVGRADLADRAAVLAGSLAEAAERLDAVARGEAVPGAVEGRRRSEGPPRVAFVVPHREEEAGDGRLLAALIRRSPAVAALVEELAEAVGPEAAAPLRAAAESGAATPGASGLVAYAAALALGRWWSAVGVRPDLVVGHGPAAHAAAALAGVWTAAEGARVAAGLAGPQEVARRTPTAELLPDGEEATAAPGEDAAGTARAIRERSVQAVVDLGRPAVGPAFLALPREEEDEEAVAAACLPSPAGDTGAEDGVGALLLAAARVWAAGVDLDWTRINGPRPARPVQLPTYPFQRHAYWPDVDPQAALSRTPYTGEGVGLTPRMLSTATGGVVGESELSLRQVPFLEEHRVHGRLVVPGMVFIELVLRCAERAFGCPARTQELSISRPLVLGEEDSATVQVVVDPPSAGRARARLFSGGPEAGWKLHFETVLEAVPEGQEPAALPAAAEGGGPDYAGALERSRRVLTEEEFYQRAWHPLFRLGPSFRLIRGARSGDRAAVGTVVPPAPDAAGVLAGIRPELLLIDACIQLLAIATLPDDLDAIPADRPVQLGTGCAHMVTGDLKAALQAADVRMESVAVLREAEDGTILGDLRMTDADGRLLAELTGVAYRSVAPSMLERLVAERPASGAADGGDTLPALDANRLRATPEPERTRELVDHLGRSMARILGMRPEEIDPKASLEGLADSLMIAELRTDVERWLDVSVPVEAFFDQGSLTSLARYIIGIWKDDAPDMTTAPTEAGQAPAAQTAPAPAAAPAPAKPKAKAKPSKSMTVPQMTELAALDAEIAVTGEPEPYDPAAPTLLTGATGFVGAFLLDELMKQRQGEVHCLVRARDEDHAMRRLTENLLHYGIDPEPYRSRIVPVLGDLAKPGLGLDAARFNALHDAVGDIVHCGGMVKWTYGYKGLQGANVAGTREVLRLATSGAPRPVHFISTVGVFSSKEFAAETVDETVDMETSGPLVVGYAQTKWVAERMMRYAGERGLPVTIHRINTGGHSVTGAFNRFDHLSMILKGCVQARIAPSSVAVMPVQPAPIDYVAAAVVAAASRPALHGRTFHLVNPESMTWPQLFDAVEEFGYPLGRLAFGDWRDRITGRNAGTLALLGLAPFLHESIDDTKLPFSESGLTRQWLEEGGTGLACPPLDTGLVHTFLRGFVEAGFLEPPAAPGA
ncbi:thioester reductase domain-containing protein [Streptomyces sp. DSM 44917]|uniref:Thioester reductase domain-containing protein n=1 Tax=Streptomyces boetiae TaxID=3075541 RepID=A0ABU2LBD9_9ACTN|nr:thioester reductase domain-containing protein [Streptomyces sp. DSM 44917]MDT0308874.1 thioester reductase domain-containing protein [Streptomyces sp. DSM 44917]